mmetsp:Transcript_29855/g.45782  ORF Transcript_29855/g.45782 Transcript_29855/m.45782 type:complete len:649 (-) Transcript_29855:1602-3548(-)
MMGISRPAWILGCFIVFITSATFVVVVVVQSLQSPGKSDKPPTPRMEPRISDEEADIPSKTISSYPSYVPSVSTVDSTPTFLIRTTSKSPSFWPSPLLLPSSLPTYTTIVPSPQHEPLADNEGIPKPMQLDVMTYSPTISPIDSPFMSPHWKPSALSLIPTLVPTDDYVTNSPSRLVELPSMNPTIFVVPSRFPSNPISSTDTPSATPTIEQTVSISISDRQLSYQPSFLETSVPSTIAVNERPSHAPSLIPVLPLPRSTNPPSITPHVDKVTYIPGELSVIENGLLLSTGLTARLVAQSNTPVKLNHANSSLMFHKEPDFADTFAIPEDDPHNPGGWVYVSNAEVLQNEGGVGSITFDKDGNAVGYQMLLKGTTRNCGGGKTPWGTFISCEEVSIVGLCHQVDPFNRRPSEPISMTLGGGRYESFAHDARNLSQPRFFVSEDRKRGALRRFTPYDPNWNDPWSILHGNGTLDYLVLHPDKTNHSLGSFEWVSDHRAAMLNAGLYYPHSEGIDVDSKGNLFMVAKKIKRLFILNLDAGTYLNETTQSGIFDGGPDQLQSLEQDGVYYMTEEGGKDAGVHGRNKDGQFFTILESPQYSDETTGLSFSPDGYHMYVAYQHNGLLFDVTRLDGFPFHGRTLNIKYHTSKIR